MTQCNCNYFLGNVGFGTTLPIGELHVCSVSTTNGTRGITSAQYSDSPQAAVLSLRKARGPETSPQPVAMGDNIGNKSFVGYGPGTAS